MCCRVLQRDVSVGKAQKRGRVNRKESLGRVCVCGWGGGFTSHHRLDSIAGYLIDISR